MRLIVRNIELSYFHLKFLLGVPLNSLRLTFPRASSAATYEFGKCQLMQFLNILDLKRFNLVVSDFALFITPGRYLAMISPSTLRST